ncbi:MAG: hypothetical protein EBR09_10520 [Proteobacteria bacterium]|nr:hypothetical protein [Pseudomonadota bacterium]
MSWFATLDNLAFGLERRTKEWICFLRYETGPLACHPDARDYSLPDTVTRAARSSPEPFVRCTFIARPKLARSEFVPEKFFSSEDSHRSGLSVFLVPFFSVGTVASAQPLPCLQWIYEDYIEISGRSSDATPAVHTGGALFSDLRSFDDVLKIAEHSKAGANELSISDEPDSVTPAAWTFNQSAESVRKMIDHLQSGMRRGNYYLANATTRVSGPARRSGDVSLYSFVKEWLRSPVRQGVFVGCGQELPAVCCFSPERFILRRGAFVQTEPIKGTAPVLAGEPDSGVSVLWSSEKEMSEQRLVTDLLRNDLNRVCRAGTVTVTSPCEVHAANSLLQMQSVVTGELADPNISHARLLGELLPAGSVSGTPKRAVSREISVIEESPRGYYTGVFACEGSQGELDSAVLIRGFFADEKQWTAGIGAGITTLSDPDAEVREFELKWRSFAQRWQRLTGVCAPDAEQGRGVKK